MSVPAAPDAAGPERAGILWCCHVRGPDDVHAAPDYETALAWADYTNALNWRAIGGRTEAVATYEDIILRAVPAPWPWSPEEHAEELPKSIAGFVVPKEPPPDAPEALKELWRFQQRVAT